uniref:Uncharacterized protein n=1 Tax=Glossina pallidipes TaxID=7398 RepID=A0A1B0A0X4_GLOPL
MLKTVSIGTTLVARCPEILTHSASRRTGLCCVAVVEIVANDVWDFVVCGVNAEVVVVIVVVIAGPSSNDDANDVMETNSTGCGAVTLVVIIAGVIVVVIVVIGFAIVVKQGNEGSVPATAVAAAAAAAADTGSNERGIAIGYGLGDLKRPLTSACQFN